MLCARLPGERASGHGRHRCERAKRRLIEWGRRSLPTDRDVGESLYDKAAGLYDLVATCGGTAIFIAGGQIVSDEIQTAKNLRLSFLLMDGVMKVMKPDFVVKATVEMGYPEDVIFGLGIVVLICVVLYIIPNTAVLGAILLTGYLGGAVATHVRHGDPLSHVLAPVYFAILLWGGLYLREPRLSALIPLRK